MDRNKNIICTMDDVRGDFLRPPHGTIPAAVIANSHCYFARKMIFSQPEEVCTKKNFANGFFHELRMS